jgi:putative ABC transport system permease protein
MNTLESMRVALGALMANKLRSGLTMLGIIIGVAAIVCVESVGAGARAEVSEKIRTLGANLLLVMPGAPRSGAVRLETGAMATLTEDDAATILRQVPSVQVAAPLLSRSKHLVAGTGTGCH